VTIQFQGDRILVGGHPDLVLGGEFQYFRIKRERWESLLQTFKEAGVNLLSVYVPWIWHEIAEGEFDFDGRTAPERDLRGFLFLCRRLGIPLMLKPGPYIYAEYQGFGIPHWLGKRYPEALMQTPQDPAHRAVYLNHPIFLQLVRRWFESLAPLIQPMVAAGEVVALQLDNETGMPQYGAGPFLVDHNGEALRRLRQTLAHRYTTIEALNTAWETTYPDFDSLVPAAERPRTRAMLEDLATFVEDGIVQYLGTLRQSWVDLGIEPHFTLNDTWLPAWPNHVRKKNAVAPVGYDIYPKFIRVASPLDQPYAISFVPKMFAAMQSRGPLIAPEIGAGWLDVGVKVPVVATFQKMLASYLRGSQANILYPLHEGEDPDGHRYLFRSPFNHRGERSERMEVVEALGTFRQDWGRLIARSEELHSPVGILHHQDGTRDLLETCTDPRGLSSDLLDAALDRGLTQYPANSGLYGALVEGGYQPRVYELSTTPLETLRTCRVLFFNGTGNLPPELVARLETYVREGGCLVTLGESFSEAGSTLFPGRTKRTWHPRSLAVVTGTLTDLAAFRLRDGKKIAHPLVRYTLDKLQPVMGMIKHATRAGVWVADHAYGGKVWASRRITYMTVPPGARELLSYARSPIGYACPVESGETVHLGTLLGPIVDSPGYYLDEPARKQSVISFLGSFLAERNIRSLTRAIPGVEPILRRTDEGMILALINRGERREFSLPLDPSWQLGPILQQFAYLGSVAQHAETLSGTLESGDVLCIHLGRIVSEG